MISPIFGTPSPLGRARHRWMGPSFADPSSLTGLAAWHRADRGVWSDGAGTTPATDTGAVLRWDDLSGNGRHALRYGADPTPTLAAAAIGGRPALDSGGNGRLAPAATWTLPAAHTVFAVLGHSSGGRPDLIAILDDATSTGTNSSGTLALYFSYWPGWWYAGGTGAAPNSSTAPLPNPAVVGLRSDGTTIAKFRCGTAAEWTAPPTGKVQAVAWSIGGGQTNVPYNFRIAELIAYDRCLAAGEMELIWSYLSSRYGT